MVWKSCDRSGLAGVWFFVAVAALILLGFVVGTSRAQQVALQKPSLQGGSFLEDEAGIAAYMKAPLDIDLQRAKQAFRTIEQDTVDYIIGSVSLPGYGEQEDPHAYVTRDGWIVVYYLKDEPVAKIIDWNAFEATQTVEETKLTSGISVICNYAGIGVSAIAYYHFQYPTANRLMIVVETLWGTGKVNTFTIRLPVSFAFFERSFAHYMFNTDSYSRWSTVNLDGSRISYLAPSGSTSLSSTGVLSPSQLSLNQDHSFKMEVQYGNINLRAAFALLLTYMEP